jgi:hypothetical protein
MKPLMNGMSAKLYTSDASFIYLFNDFERKSDGLATMRHIFFFYCHCCFSSDILFCDVGFGMVVRIVTMDFMQTSEKMWSREVYSRLIKNFSKFLFDRNYDYATFFLFLSFAYVICVCLPHRFTFGREINAKSEEFYFFLSINIDVNFKQIF